jgi:catechol 2,3-dioxygenase-like lactoylglutathione lyase family enzyme
MGAPPPDLMAYHVGFVVRDLEATADAYRRMLGVDRWRVHDLKVELVPWNPRYTAALVKVAYGRGAGLTFELIQVLEGRTQHLDFLEQHGEGVQHIGFWTDDVRASVRQAVEQGATVVSARFGEDDQAVIQLTPASSQSDIVAGLPQGRLAYVEPGLGGVQMEFVGPVQAPNLKAWMEEDFSKIVIPAPPWEV